jgi:hypothetical protein
MCSSPSGELPITSVVSGSRDFMSKRIRIFSTVGLLCMLILAVFEVPVAASKDQIDPNSEESVFSLTQVFNKLSSLEVKDNSAVFVCRAADADVSAATGIGFQGPQATCVSPRT